MTAFINHAILTAREAAFILRCPPERLNHALDALGKSDTARPVKFLFIGDFHELLKLAFDSPRELSSDIFQAIGAALSKLDATSGASKGALLLDLDTASPALLLALDALRLIKDSAQTGPKGEALIKGTSIHIHQISALASVSISNALFDYPSLNPDQVTIACAYSALYPHTGAPYPTRSFKRMLLDLGDPDPDVDFTGMED